MPLKAVVESLDDVPEAFHAEYEEQDGAFRLKVEGVEFPEEVQGLKKALEAERRKAREASKRLSSLPEDFDPEKWQAMQEAEAKRAEEAAAKKGEWENLRKQLQENHTKEKEQYQTQLTTLEKQLNTLLIDNEATQLLSSKYKGSAKLLMPHIRGSTQVVEEEGARKVVVVDERGERRYDGKTGEPMTIEGLIAEMRESDEFAPAFEGSGATGGGASGRQAAGGGSRVRSKADFKSRSEKLAYIKEHGDEAFIALPDK